MKNVIILSIYFWAIILSAQTTPRTIYCNEFQNVALILPKPIQQAVTGSEEFVFSYNKTSPDSLGLLQGRPGRGSNLLIRTTEGNLYSYLLKHADTLSQFTHFITLRESINQVKSLDLSQNNIKENPVSKAKNPGSKKVENLNKGSRYFINNSNSQRIGSIRKNRIQLTVKSINYYSDEIYVVYAIYNRSRITYEINNLQLNKVQGKKGRRSSHQKWGITPIYKYKFPGAVSTGQKATFVVVYPKFTLGDNEKLEVVLTEKRGSRYLDLRVML